MIGTRMRSGSIVAFIHGLTLVVGLGGSERTCKLALRNELPTVSMPWWYPDWRRFTFLRSPLPAGLREPHWLLSSLGRSSFGSTAAPLVQLGGRQDNRALMGHVHRWSRSTRQTKPTVTSLAPFLAMPPASAVDAGAARSHPWQRVLLSC